MNGLHLKTITRDSPRIKIVVRWDSDEPQGQIVLLMKRVGSPSYFAEYTPLSVQGGEILFEFDELLFTQTPGRFAGLLKEGENVVGIVQIQYKNQTEIVGVTK